MSEVYRNISRRQICQLDIADHYDHKHQDLSAVDRLSGLTKMSTDIAKSLYRKLATEGIQMDKAFFRILKAAYLRIALDFVETYCHNARINGLSFSADPPENLFINSWKKVTSAVPDLIPRFYAAVE